MAIQKEKTLPSGATGNYWRITNIFIDRQNFKIVGEIALFKDAAASAAGNLPMGGHKKFKFNLVMAEIAPPTNLIAYMYGKIQAAADVVITKDLLGNDLPQQTTADPDLSGGTPVL